ncbi:AAA family ATPase (plasmid) [Skermanella mucosa]|uniref:AAA family ATPase n=1 Tax=Skermanella mucosa TaxID=1789672 RepID=UPI00192BA7F5|nr:AAA family ATPase [Skermanella mucosa]UEM25099.1 AAA family ATPase [Skermanella mucosa]
MTALAQPSHSPLAAPAPAPSPASAGERGGKVVAYVTDAATEATLRQAAAQLLVGEFEVRRGDVRTAARDLARQRSPALLIVDISGIELPIGAMEALSQVCEPSVTVVAIGDRNDVALYRNLRGLGVAEYLFKPLPADQVEALLGRAAGTAARGEEAGRQGKLIAVTGARGGVGTTTVAVNLAAYLADIDRRRIALVDLDLHTGTVALHLNLKPGRGLREAVEAPERVDALFLERAMQQASDRLDVLATEEPILPPVAQNPRAVLDLLDCLKGRYHYVVADVPHGLSETARAVLDHAALRIIVADGNLAGARDALRLRGAFEASGTARQTLTVHNRRGAPGALSPADFGRALGSPADCAIECRPKPLIEAATLGEPAIRRCAPFKSDISRLAGAVSGQSATGAAGLLARLFRSGRAAR